ncbi:hypothetical protein NP493_251g00024 [Ridgeia piscesae]|uniref:Uncharacterized protein n=1 Tax=Ridgeia piscesae TaxID=27915 RepID=A0AAD9UD17_RIDPI|nr:hypothetical protein NP493_251g00024 [Ridgeia piscesae]
MDRVILILTVRLWDSGVARILHRDDQITEQQTERQPKHTTTNIETTKAQNDQHKDNENTERPTERRPKQQQTETTKTQNDQQLCLYALLQIYKHYWLVDFVLSPPPLSISTAHSGPIGHVVKVWIRDVGSSVYLYRRRTDRMWLNDLCFVFITPLSHTRKLTIRKITWFYGE